MAKRRQTIDIVPSARRMIENMRDVGYDFVHSVADLVDNSIVAGASTVRIDFEFAGPESWIRISDDGSGMDVATLNEAMRPGADRMYAPDDLGKFGLGLKTASLSQCRLLTVASRTDANRRRIDARQLDLDWMIKSNQWKAFVLGSDDREARLVEPLHSGKGTVILWENLDRILGYRNPWGEWARSGLLALAEQLENHLAMVFHRFLAGEIPRRKKLNIFVSGARVEAWDPFSRAEKSTETLPVEEFRVETHTGPGIVRLRRYVLPPKNKFSSDAAWHRAGLNRWNALQGLYIFRANRLIQAGGWNRMRTQDEHSKLARAALDFFPDLDSAFEINWAKVRVSPPADLRERLKQPLEDLVRSAKAVYSRSSEETRSRGGGGRSRSGRGGHVGEPKGHYARDGGGVRMPRTALETAAKRVGETDALGRIVKELKAEEPEVARALGW